MPVFILANSTDPGPDLDHTLIAFLRCFFFNFQQTTAYCKAQNYPSCIGSTIYPLVSSVDNLNANRLDPDQTV